MSTLRLLIKGLRFGTRAKKRFIPFLVVYIFLSIVTIFLVGQFDPAQQEDLLSDKGVVVTAANWDVVTLQAADSIFSTYKARGDVEAVLYFRYINFGPSLRIFGIDTRYTWAWNDVRPNTLAKGHFISHRGQAMVSEDFSLDALTVGSTKAFVHAGIGTVLSFGTGANDPNAINVKIVGQFKKSPRAAEDTREWIILSKKDFESLVGILGLNQNTDVYVRDVVILAAGNSLLSAFFGKDVYETVDQIANQVTSDISGNSAWDNTPTYTKRADKLQKRTFAVFAAVVGIFGTLFVSIIYSYLITRFRNREMAILKAIGYKSRQIQIIVLGEIINVALGGFIIGLLLFQLVIYVQAVFLYNQIYYRWVLTSVTSFLALLAIVIFSIPGFLILSRRSLSIRPIEILRQM